MGGFQAEGLWDRLRLSRVWLWLLVLLLMPYQVRGGESEVVLWKPEGVEDPRPTCVCEMFSFAR